MTASNDLVLYSNRACPFAQRSRIVLAEKGIEHTLEEVSLRETPDWFLAISPHGKVPLLAHRGARLWESAVINEYLDEVFPEPPLVPDDPHARGLMRIWVEYANTQFLPLFYKLLLEPDAMGRVRHAGRLRETLAYMDRHGPGEAGGPWWLGEAYSLADVAFYPFFERFNVLAHYRGFEIPAGLDALARWLGAMGERAAIRACAGDPDLYIRAYARYADGSADGSTAREMREA